MRITKVKAGVGAIALVAILVPLGLWGASTVLSSGAGEASAQSQPTGNPSGQVLLTYGLGGIVTADGTLWQYRPDFKRWMTVDEAFREEGRTTHILPLPVPATEIQDMESFGFILTRSGQIWFYEMETDKWKLIEPPR